MRKRVTDLRSIRFTNFKVYVLGTMRLKSLLRKIRAAINTLVVIKLVLTEIYRVIQIP